MSYKTGVIIPAAGMGKRMKLNHPKQYQELAGTPILIHTVRAFTACDKISQLVVPVPADMIEVTNTLFEKYGLADVQVIAGGVRRQDSVYEGLKQIKDNVDIVLVHDGARPMVEQDLIIRCIEAAGKHGAAIAAIPVKDTLKKGDDNNMVVKTVDREALWQAQTPQAAKKELLVNAFAMNGTRDVTDESGLFEKCGVDVCLVEGSEKNLKITRPEDLHIAEKIMTKSIPDIRIGHGFDAHKFEEGRKLVLGGITIPHDQGLAGHSDADVLTHALCDAILGGAGMGDIGKHFPDTSDAFKDIYSVKLLVTVMSHICEFGYCLGNADITVVCQSPRLSPHIEAMTQVLAEACGVESGQINIKATTTEKMGYTGRAEGISCHAVALLHKI